MLSTSSRRGYGPAALALLTFAVAAGAWIQAQRWIPEDPRRVRFPPPTMLASPPGAQPFFASGDPNEADVIFIGDSRAWQAFVPSELESAGIGRCAVVGRGGGQLVDLIEYVRRYPGRRLVVSVTPRSLFEKQQELQRQVPRGFNRAGIERVTNAWARSLTRYLVPSIDPSVWERGWVLPLNPTTSNGIYMAMLSEESRAERLRNLVRATKLLREMKADGWDVFCVRLPISPQLRAVEEQRFDSSLFGQAFDSIGVPYRDLSEVRQPTIDGSHLTASASARFSAAFGGILSRRPGWSKAAR